jgi:tetratricopeptide (TPR) repeat protein
MFLTLSKKWSAIVVVANILFFAGGSASTQTLGPPSDCGSLDNAFGPFDYTDPQDRSQHLGIVEGRHFNRNVATLRRGVTAVNPLGDLDYTLRAFPNHHGALDAMARLHRRQNADKLTGGRYTISCWFERAKQFKPSDGVVLLLEGVHRFRTNDMRGAEMSLLQAVSMMPTSAEAHYSLGLLYARMERFEEALSHAELAYDMGYPLPGLKKILIDAGVWPNSPADSAPDKVPD